MYSQKIINMLIPHINIVYGLPKKLAKGSWLPKNSLNTSSGLRNVKVNPGKSDEKSELEEPGKLSRQGERERDRNGDDNIRGQNGEK